MRRLTVLTLGAILTLGTAGGAHAATKQIHDRGSGVNVQPSREHGLGKVDSRTTPKPIAGTSGWAVHDTAVYVLSTVNLLHTGGGVPASKYLIPTSHVKLYDVFQDTRISDLYFIQMERSNESTGGVFVYRIGWAKPMFVSPNSLARIAVRAPAWLADEYHAGHKHLIGSFTSTVPA